MIIKAVVKTGLAGVAVFYIKDLGVWGNSKQTEKIYSDFTEFMRPYLFQAKQQLPFEPPPLPKTGEMKFLAKHYYNQAIKSSFKCISMIPCYTGQLIKKAKDGINKAIDAPPK